MELEMQIICCAACGIPFALSKDKVGRLRSTHESFYCPVGHSQSFAGKTETERRLESMTARAMTAERLLDEEKAKRAEEQRLAKSKKRARVKTSPKGKK